MISARGATYHDDSNVNYSLSMRPYWNVDKSYYTRYYAQVLVSAVAATIAGLAGGATTAAKVYSFAQVICTTLNSMGLKNAYYYVVKDQTCTTNYTDPYAWVIYRTKWTITSFRNSNYTGEIAKQVVIKDSNSPL